MNQAHRIRTDYPSLAEFLSAWFHQDWSFGKRSLADVVRLFVASSPPEQVAQVEGELGNLLASDREGDINEAFLAFRTSLDPRRFGLTWAELGDQIYSELRRSAELVEGQNRMPLPEAYWWSTDAAERLWVEIRRVPGIGSELRAPRTDVRGNRNAWYELLDAVRTGDLIYHWSARETRFVGQSFALKSRQYADGERVVPLEGFSPLEVTVDLRALRDRMPKLTAIRKQLSDEYPGWRLYLPFQFRSDGIRLMSNYFAKLPVAMATTLFSIDVYGELSASRNGTRHIRRQYLEPLKPRADTSYISMTQAEVSTRRHEHQTLVNDFARWLNDHGKVPAFNHAIDLALTEPLVVIEAKSIRGSWAAAIRAAVSQLYEYRYFQLVAQTARLVLLASDAVPTQWQRYLEEDRGIAVIWQSSDGDFRLSMLARQYLEVS